MEIAPNGVSQTHATAFKAMSATGRPATVLLAATLLTAGRQDSAFMFRRVSPGQLTPATPRGPQPGTYRQADRTRGDDARGRATRTAAWPQVANRPAPLAHRRSAQASRRSGCSVRAGLLAAGYGERHGVPMPAGRRRILMADIRLDMLPRRAARTIMLGCSLFARLPRYGPSAPGMVRHFVTASLGRGVHGPAARDSLRYSLIPRRVVKIGLLIRGIRGSSPWRRTRLDLATRSPA